jgi:hypothetical protein
MHCQCLLLTQSGHAQREKIEAIFALYSSRRHIS